MEYLEAVVTFELQPSCARQRSVGMTGSNLMPLGQRKLRLQFEKEALVHMDALYGLALRLAKNERDAEDLVQDTCLKAYQHFAKYTQGTNCKAWLFKILTNTFINRYRKKQREQTYFSEDFSPSPIERLTSKEDNPVAKAARDQTELFDRLFGDEVSAALIKVPVDFRMAVLLVDLYDFSYKETADIMGCPIGTVMSRLYRGRRLLQKMLLEYAVNEGIIGSEWTTTQRKKSPNREQNADSDSNVVPFPKSASAT